MESAERANNIRPEVIDKAVKDYQLGKSVDAGRLNLPEFDEWLKHTVLKYRYPLLGAVVIYTGWLAYRFVDKFLKSREQP